jgi:HSP20 family protein
MPDTDRTQSTTEKQTATKTEEQPSTPQKTNQSQSGSLARRNPSSWGSPFGLLFQRWNDEMDRLFEDFGLGRTSITRGQTVTEWSPQVEMFQRGNDLVVRADLPGMRREDIQVEITEDALTIQGERRQQQEEEREGWYRNERNYGCFYRAIPLPEGTIADSAKANFKDGVLEVVLQAPSREVNRGRRLEIKE